MSEIRRRFPKWWVIVAALPVLLIILAFVIVLQAKAFLKSDRFRTFLSDKVSQTIRAKGTFLPLDWNGSSFYSEGFTAPGGEGTWGDIEARQIRADVELRGLWEKKWQVDGVEVEHLSLTPGQETIVQPKVKSERKASPREGSGRKVPGFPNSWLPTRVEVQKVTVADFRMDGENLATPLLLEKMKVEARPDGDAWMLAATSGNISIKNFPQLSVEELSLRYVKNEVFVSRGTMLVSGGGKLSLSGRAQTSSPAGSDVNIKAEGIPALTALPEDWRARLHGNFSADFHLVQKGKEWVANGPVTLSNGRLEGLPILDQVALFTRTQRFRQLNLENVRADLAIDRNTVTATNLNAESPGLLRITGGFVIKKGKMKGDFMVGVTPASLRYIPGSQSKVFTLEKEGYLWAPMIVNGPVEHLKEDLSGRLATAAGQDIIDSIQKDPTKLQDTLQNAAETLLNLFGK